MTDVQVAPRPSPFMAGTLPGHQSKDQATSKSKQIFRRITTKLRLPLAHNVPLPPSLPRLAPPPQHVNAFTSKENRDAALRERGLLPPLRPKPDLSVQEVRQDRRLSVIVPPPAETDSDGEVSAATKIKREWEARNVSSSEAGPSATTRTDPGVRLRLNTFKFGGVSANASASAPSLIVTDPVPSPEALAQTLLSPVQEVDTPEPSPPCPKSPPSRSPSMRSNLSRSSRPGTLEVPRKRSLPSMRPSPKSPLPPLPLDVDLAQAAAISLPPSPLPSPRLPLLNLEAHLVPLPPSPITPVLELPSNLSDPCSIPLPSSPSLHSYTPPSQSPTIETPGDETPKGHPMLQETRDLQLPTLSFSTPSLLINGTLSPPEPLSPLSVCEGTEESPSVSNTSLATPSLCVDSASQVGTISTLASFDSPSGGTKANIKIRPPDNAIPVIMESPVEEAFVPSTIVDEPAEMEPESDSTPTPEQKREVRPRSTTDPGVLGMGAGHSIRKSLSFFRRADGHATDTSSLASEMSETQTLASKTQKPKRQLSVTASIKRGFRRSVIGSLSRVTKSPRLFDASHLPPSPTLATASNPTTTSDAPVVDDVLSPETALGKKGVVRETDGSQSASPTTSQSLPSISGRQRGATMPSPSSSPSPPQRRESKTLLRSGTSGAVPRSPPTFSRLGVAPTMHNRASILVEASKIEDQESQRLSELAFLV